LYNTNKTPQKKRLQREKGEMVMKKFVTFLLALCLAAALPLCSFSACDDGGSSVPPPVQGGENGGGENGGGENGGGDNGGGENGGGDNGGGDNGGDGGFEIGPY
jgi:hypothetical protein